MQQLGFMEANSSTVDTGASSWFDDNKAWLIAIAAALAAFAIFKAIEK